MLEHLFGSKTRLKLLKTFFRDPVKSYYVRELTRLLDVQINAIRRELQLLSDAGIVVETESPGGIDTSDASANAAMRKYYRLNVDSLLFPELQALVNKGQVMGEQAFVKDIQQKSGELALFVLTGRFLNERRAPSDMLLVGDVRERILERLVADYEREFGFEIRYTTMSQKEFFERRHIMDKFLYSLFEGEHVKVVNTLNI